MTLKHCAIEPANNLFPRAQPDLFGGMPNMLDSSNPPKQDLIFIPELQGGERRCGLQLPVFGTGTNNLSGVFQNLLISPVKRPHFSRNRPHMFML